MIGGMHFGCMRRVQFTVYHMNVLTWMEDQFPGLNLTARTSSTKASLVVELSRPRTVAMSPKLCKHRVERYTLIKKRY